MFIAGNQNQVVREGDRGNPDVVGLNRAANTLERNISRAKCSATSEVIGSTSVAKATVS
jgi:hypothetical protein